MQRRVITNKLIMYCIILVLVFVIGFIVYESWLKPFMSTMNAGATTAGRATKPSKMLESRLNQRAAAKTG